MMRMGRLLLMATFAASAVASLAACSGQHTSPSSTSAEASGTLTVSWKAPAQNSDGTPLGDLVGYTIFYGPAPNTYTSAIPINDPAATRYVVTGLRPGTTYYFAISATNSSGHHSLFSGEAHAVAK
jgi:ABC-type oligopeptide transport system substrate-binding subunit